MAMMLASINGDLLFIALYASVQAHGRSSGCFQIKFRLMACMTAAVVFRTSSLHMMLCI